MVIRDIRNADVSSRSRVVPITIVMTINLVPVEIARGDVATTAGIASPVLNYFWRKLTGGERIKRRAPACGRNTTRQQARRKRSHRERRSWSEMDKRAVIRLTVLFHRRKSLFLLWDTSGAVAGARRRSCLQNITHHVRECTLPWTPCSQWFSDRRKCFFFLLGHFFFIWQYLKR